MCLGLHTDTEGNVMDVVWPYGGKLVEADDKTVASTRRAQSRR